MLWRPDLSAQSEPYKVLLKKGEFTDETRQNDDGSVRTVPYKLYYPSIETPDLNPEKMPVILWSHGYGGNRDGAGFISRFVASHGYIIVHMTHHGTDSSLWEGKPGHPWDILRQTRVSRKTSLNRFKDVPFILDCLTGWAQENPDVGDLMDFAKIGMAGHSFGSLSTQIAAGQLFPGLDKNLTSLREERIQAGILYSPVPLADHLLDELSGPNTENVYKTISIPLLHMTGSDDSSPIGDHPYTHRLPVYEGTGHGEKYLLVKEGGDHMVYNGTRGKLTQNPMRDRHEEIIRIFSLAFWDMQLKGDGAAQTWLLGDGAQDFLNGDGSFKFERMPPAR